MLESLHVKNLVLIEEVEVEFSEGLNIMSGETGAGKSIIIDSIGIALGGKVSKDIIRKGAEYALVELVFSVDTEVKRQKLEDLGITVEDDMVIISKKITQTKCINKVNGENVTNTTLKRMGEILIDVHGQHQNHSLLMKKNHLNLLDKFAKDELGDLLDELASIYKEYVKARKELETSVVDEESRNREISFLEYEINEIKNAELKVGEDEELDNQFKKLSSMNTIMSSLSCVHNYLSDSVSESAADNVARSVRELSKVSTLDECLEEYLEQLITVESLLSDLNKDVVNYMDRCDDVSEELATVEERLNLINGLKMKYGNSIDVILSYMKQQEEKLSKLKNYDEYVESLKIKVDSLEFKVNILSEKVSSIRMNNAKILTDRIRESLIDLNFLDVQFEMIFNRTKDYTEKGIDDALFYISTNPGELLRPLSEVASGGEISRIMLAIKSVLANMDSIDSLIFDEIDTGISGRTAQKVSEKLAVIAKQRQVICITHLPQIAAMADTHFVIGKISDGENTRSDIYRLSDSEAVNEIARIIGGVQITESVLSNAREMIQLAQGIKCMNA
ncbi:MAG: DNA repair protein RecN [Lachnospiraceae bacterium]|nr:DNA repair protein RecN [Lachnospiraceae bacterium]